MIVVINFSKEEQKKKKGKSVKDKGMSPVLAF